MVLLLGALLSAMAEPTYDHAVTELHSPATWCAGAASLARLGRPEALVPLLAAYETRAESERMCLLDAMESLAKAGAAEALWASADPASKRAALRTMHLCPNERYLPVLERAVADSTWEKVALGALRAQIRTEGWESVLIRQLGSASRAVRAQAIEGLGGRRSAAVKAALAARVGVEPDPELQAKIVAIIGH